MTVLLGIDAGTTSLKAALYDLEGRLLASDRQEYDLLTPSPSIVELDAETYWQACRTAVRNAVALSEVDPEEIAGLCISSQGETLIPVDSQGNPTRRAIVWMDNRATEEAAVIGQHFDVDEVYHVTGQPEISPTWPACKLLWIRTHEPEVFSRSARFLLLEDYLLYRLTGQFVTEYSIQTSSMMVDIQRKMWWTPMLDFIGAPADRLSRLMEPGAIVGPLSEGGAQATGLSPRTVAVTGAMDQIYCAVGAGNIAPDMVTETTGGALAILVTTDEPRFDPQRRVPCNYHARPDTYCMMPWAQTAGMALRWFRDQFYKLETQVARDSQLNAYDLITLAAAHVPAGSDGLVVLPHLEGAMCPEFNPAARAVFFGASLLHTKAHFARAIMESVAYMLKKNLEIVEELGVDVSEIRSMGGGAVSAMWLSIKADVLQKPVTAVAVEEAGCLGAAIMAGVAIGAHASYEEAIAHMVRLRETIQPNPDHADVYGKGYRRYVELYDRLEPMFQ